MRNARECSKGARPGTHRLFAPQQLRPPPSPGTAAPTAQQHPQWTTVGSDPTTAPIACCLGLEPGAAAVPKPFSHHFEVSAALEDLGDVVNLPRRSRRVHIAILRKELAPYGVRDMHLSASVFGPAAALAAGRRLCVTIQLFDCPPATPGAPSVALRRGKGLISRRQLARYAPAVRQVKHQPPATGPAWLYSPRAATNGPAARRAP